MTFDSPLNVAYAILDKAEESGMTVTPMQLQKLLYFVNGWFLETQDGRDLFQNKFEAWTWGPVMPSVYQAFKGFGKNAIAGSMPYELKFPIGNLIEEILRIYGSLDGVSMSMLTHKDGTPWHTVWNNSLGKGLPIPSDLILEEFRRVRAAATSA